jgi:hypothetical protein
MPLPYKDICSDSFETLCIVKIVNRLQGHYGNFKITRSHYGPPSIGKDWQAYCEVTNFNDLQFKVNIRPDCEHRLFIENLIHEVAHVVAATKNPKYINSWFGPDRGHNEEWGLAYAEVYKLCRLSLQRIKTEHNYINKKKFSRYEIP